MAAATTITESEARTYADATLGTFADFLGWTVALGSYNEIVNDAVGEYGETLITAVSGVKQTQLMKACVRYVLWRTVTQVSNDKFNISQTGTGLSLSQVNDHARASMQFALDEMARLRLDVASDEADLDPGEQAISVTTVIRETTEYPALGSEALSEYA